MPGFCAKMLPLEPVDISQRSLKPPVMSAKHPLIICNHFTAKSPPSRLSGNRNIEEGTLRHFGGHIGLVLGSNATSCHIPSKCHYVASSFPCLEQASPANEFEDASLL